MNLAGPNSGGRAVLPPPVRNIEIQILLPDGSCIPATPANARQIMKQARSAMLKVRKAKRQEIAAELQRNLEDRRASRALLDELAAYDRDRRRIAAVLCAKARPDGPAQEASPVRKTRTVLRSGIVTKPKLQSSWVIDDHGMRGVQYHQSYLSRASPSFYRGAAADRWFYDVRDEAVVRDADGNVIWFSNLGDDIDEVAAAWQAVEDASTRKNGKVQIRIIVPLDADALPAEQAAALRYFCEQVLRPLGLPYSAVMHHAPEEGDARNAHGHILTNLRPTERVAPYSWAVADEIRGELDGKNGVQMLRHLWAHAMSEAAETSGRNMRYTGLSYAARGLALEAGEHLGEAKAAMVAQGTRVWAHERNRIKTACNAQHLILRDIDRKMAALIQIRDILDADQRRKDVEPQQVFAPAAPFLDKRKRLQAAAPPPVEAQRLLTVIVPSGDPVNLPTSTRPIAALVQPLNITRRMLPDTGGRQPLLGAGIGSQPTSRSATPLGTTKDVAPKIKSLVIAAPKPSAPPKRLRSATQANVPHHSTIMLADVKRPGRRTSSDRLVRASAIRSASAPHPIVETMHDLLRRLERERSIRRKNPPLTAFARRRALAAQGRASSPITMPTRTWFELNPGEAFTLAGRRQASKRHRALLERIGHGDGYVSARSDGLLVQVIAPQRMVVPDDDWWTQGDIQRALADVRKQQRELILTALLRSRIAVADLGDGPVRWKMDVSFEHRERLRLWAEHPMFQNDVVEVARQYDQERRSSNASPVVEEASSEIGAGRTADGFGGWRDSPAPVHSHAGGAIHLQAFDTSGRPSVHLLRLLHLAAGNDRALAIASDGMLTVHGKAPAMLASLVHGWRDDPAVARLVTETVRLTRNAAKPTWPDEVAVEVRALARKAAANVARSILSDPNLDRQW